MTLIIHVSPPTPTKAPVESFEVTVTVTEDPFANVATPVPVTVDCKGSVASLLLTPWCWVSSVLVTVSPSKWIKILNYYRWSSVLVEESTSMHLHRGSTSRLA